MILQIFRVIKDYESRNGNTYTLVQFTNPVTNEYFMTYVCPEHKNWSHWEKCLRKGKMIKNLIIYKDNLINADSFPKLVTKREKENIFEYAKRSKMGPEELRRYYAGLGVYI